MPVYFVQEAGRGCAFWRAANDAPDVFLCSVELTAYNSESQVRDRALPSWLTPWPLIAGAGS